MGGSHPSLRAHGPGRLLHLIANDLDEPGWLTGAEGADAEILAGLAQRLAAEAIMDDHDGAAVKADER